MTSSVQLRLLALALVVAFAAAAPVAAQGQVGPAISITPATGALALKDGQSQTVSWTIANSGPTSGSVTVTLTLPTGWTGSLAASDASFSLGGSVPPAMTGGSHAVNVIVAPVAGKAQNGTLRLDAVGTNSAGQASSASATVVLTYIPPPPLPPIPYDPWPALTVFLVALALLVGFGVYLYSGSRVQLRLNTLEVAERPGDRATYSLLIQNTSRRVRKIELRLNGLESPWTGALMVPHVLLDGEASTDIPFSISIPRDAAPGEVQGFKVQARPAGPFLWLVSRRVVTRVLQ